MKKFIKVFEYVNKENTPVFINVDKIVEVFYSNGSNIILVAFDDYNKRLSVIEENIKALSEIGIDIQSIIK